LKVTLLGIEFEVHRWRLSVRRLTRKGGPLLSWIDHPI